MPSSATKLFADISTADRPYDAKVVMRRAVVLGGSMAGLMAARVLSEHAEEVLIIERDDSGVTDRPRPGVPQGGQVHALLAGGQRQFDRWFPGFYDEVRAAGATETPGDTIQRFTNGRAEPAPARRPGARGLVATRPFLEEQVRRRTLASDNIRIAYARATGLVLEGDRVAGVRLDGDVVERADLVVDAMGRSSRLTDWLAGAGWPSAPMRRMSVNVNYATALFRRDETVSDTWAATSIVTPRHGRVPRLGSIMPVERDRWLMLISGYADDRPGRDDYVERCQRDFPPVFGQIAARGEMLGSVLTYHQADSRRRDFHRLDRFPAGLVVAGDAVASFNPIYGQGMTSATLHASCLSAYLRSEPALDRPARSYFDRVRVVVDAAWRVSTFADLELPHVTGPYPRGYRLMKWSNDLLFRAARKDPTTSARIGRVLTMMEHPSSLDRPGPLLRALRFKVS